MNCEIFGRLTLIDLSMQREVSSREGALLYFNLGYLLISTFSHIRSKISCVYTCNFDMYLQVYIHWIDVFIYLLDVNFVIILVVILYWSKSSSPMFWRYFHVQILATTWCPQLLRIFGMLDMVLQTSWQITEHF